MKRVGAASDFSMSELGWFSTEFSGVCYAASTQEPTFRQRPRRATPRRPRPRASSAGTWRKGPAQRREGPRNQPVIRVKKPRTCMSHESGVRGSSLPGPGGERFPCPGWWVNSPKCGRLLDTSSRRSPRRGPADCYRARRKRSALAFFSFVSVLLWLDLLLLPGCRSVRFRRPIKRPSDGNVFLRAFAQTRGDWIVSLGGIRHQEASQLAVVVRVHSIALRPSDKWPTSGAVPGTWCRREQTRCETEHAQNVGRLVTNLGSTSVPSFAQAHDGPLKSWVLDFSNTVAKLGQLLAGSCCNKLAGLGCA